MSTSNIEPELAVRLRYGTDPELELLGKDLATNGSDSSANEGLETAPLFTGDAFEVSGPNAFPQRALYGRIIAQECKGFSTAVKSPKLYINTNAPFSGVTCGVQVTGSGKSHSTSVLLESCLIRDERLGTLPEPLSALLFHFDTAAGGGHVQPCEAAYLASLDDTRGGGATPPKVTVLVMPGTIRAMKRAYAGLPQVLVEELHFAQEDMSGERLLTMMKVDQEQNMPLYMESIMNILRSTQDTFDYAVFRRHLLEEKFSPAQKSMLYLRLKLLDSCLDGGNSSNRVSKHFNKGQLTIIDLSSPFMDPSSACGIFNIVLGLFIEARSEASGKIVVLDEAHKYLTSSGSSSRLTDSLLSVIRQQRHLATRVLISTQEPTIVPSQFLELCSFVIVHRFSSPRWLDHLEKHISAVDSQSFSRVFTLKTGEAMIFSPSGVGLREKTLSHAEEPTCERFGRGYVLVHSRERITKDGGRSLLATPVRSSSHTEPVNLVNRGTRDASLPAAIPRLSPHVLSSLNWENDSNYAHSLDLGRAHPGTPPTEGAEIWDNPATNSSIGEVDTPVSPASVAVTTQTLASLPPGTSYSRFQPLITILVAQGRTSWTEIGTGLKLQYPPPYEGKLRDYLDDAAAAKIVELGNIYSDRRWVQLCYTPLVDTLLRLRTNVALRITVGEQVRRDYGEAFTGTFKRYVQAANAAGVIRYDPMQDTISLV